MNKSILYEFFDATLNLYYLVVLLTWIWSTSLNSWILTTIIEFLFLAALVSLRTIWRALFKDFHSWRDYNLMFERCSNKEKLVSGSYNTRLLLYHRFVNLGFFKLPARLTSKSVLVPQINLIADIRISRNPETSLVLHRTGDLHGAVFQICLIRFYSGDGRL